MPRWKTLSVVLIQFVSSRLARHNVNSPTAGKGVWPPCQADGCVYGLWRRLGRGGKNRPAAGRAGNSGGAGFEFCHRATPTGQGLAQLVQRHRLAHDFIHVCRDFPIRLHLRPPTCQ